MQGYEIGETRGVPYLYVAVEVPFAEVDLAILTAFDTVWEFMTQHGVHPAGGTITLFTRRPKNIAVFHAGYLVKKRDMDVAEGEVQAGFTPEGPSAHYVHHGSYNGLNAAYTRMLEYCRGQGLSPTMPSWQIYRNDPSIVLEEQLITDCYQALKN